MTEHINERPDEQDKHFGDEDDFAANDSTNLNDTADFVAEDATSFTDDATDAAADAAGAPHHSVDGPEPKVTAADQMGQNFRKAAEDTAYAAVGFVGLVADKAKEFYEDQKRQYADSHPESDSDTGAKNFLAQLREQLDKFIDEVNRGFRDLAERGRASGKDFERDAADKAEHMADDVADRADKAADDVADAADRAADKVGEFAEGFQRPTHEA